MRVAPDLGDWYVAIKTIYPRIEFVKSASADHVADLSWGDKFDLRKCALFYILPMIVGNVLFELSFGFVTDCADWTSRECTAVRQLVFGEVVIAISQNKEAFVEVLTVRSRALEMPAPVALFESFYLRRV